MTGPAVVDRRSHGRVLSRALSAPMSALLRDGDLDGRYASRSEAVMATAVAAVCAGWREGDWREVLEASALGQWATHRLRKTGGVRPRNGGDIERRLRTTWRKATALVAQRPPVTDHFSVRAELAEILSTADASPATWARAAGVTDRAVLAALVDIAAAACTLTVSASTRQLSEAANISPATAWKSLNRLVDTGWLRQETGAAGVHAATWRLLRPNVAAPNEDTATVLDQIPPRHVIAASSRGHDVFTHTIHGGLGRVAARLHDLLGAAQPPLHTDQLVALSGLHRRTVLRHLAALVGAGLIEATPDGWQRTHVDLDGVALQLGAAGVTAERHRRHVAQREAYVAWRADFDARRGWRMERGLYRPDHPELPLLMPQAA